MYCYSTAAPMPRVNSTNAIGLVSRSGKYGGTYAHKDIAFNFGMWLSPVFQLYIVKEYQRLKEVENNQYNLEWNVKRVLSKANYTLHTDAVKKYVIPHKSSSQKDDWVYASEVCNPPRINSVICFCRLQILILICVGLQIRRNGHIVIFLCGL